MDLFLLGDRQEVQHMRQSEMMHDDDDEDDDDDDDARYREDRGWQYEWRRMWSQGLQQIAGCKVSGIA